MIYGIIGDCGSGKTLFMTIMLLKDALKNKKVYGNYKLLFPKGCDTNLLTGAFFQKYKEYPVFNATIGFDELSLYYSNRRSMSKHNQALRPFILQTRKRSLKLFYTAQQDRLVDVNIRENTDGYYFPRMVYIRKIDNKTIIKPKKEDYEFQDGDKLILFVDYYPKENEGYVKRRQIKIKVNDYFKYYDTTEILDFEYDD
jgi:hypothetical protein